jgi:hypothetical protein
MTEDDMVKAMNGKMKVRFAGRVGIIVDSYQTSGGKTIAVVSARAPNAGIASGCNVPLDQLEIVKE